MATRNFRPPDNQASSVVGGLMLVVLVALVVGTVQVGRIWSTERHRQWAVAWMKPGSAEPGHQIKLNGARVGEVVEVGFPELRLRLDVSSPADPTRLDGTHLGAGDRATLAGATGAIELRLASLGRLDVLSRDGSFALDLIDSLGRWRISGAGVEGLSRRREWRTLALCFPRDEARCVSRGDWLAIDGVLLRWHGIRPTARVLASLDRRAITEALSPRTEARDSFRLDSTDLVGVELRETGAFGIGKQGLKLVMPGRDPALIAARPVVRTRMRYSAPTRWVVSPDSAPAIELVTSESLDMESILAMASYLSDPTMRHTPPRTRWEDIIDGTRVTVDGVRGAIGSARSSLDQVGAVARRDDGNGMVGRLVLGSPQQRRFNEAIDALPDLLDRLERLAASATVTVDSTGRSVRQLTTRLDSSLSVIEPELVRALQGARTLEDSLVTLSKELEATLAGARKAGKPVGIALLVKLLASTLLDFARLSGIR